MDTTTVRLAHQVSDNALGWLGRMRSHFALPHDVPDHELDGPALKSLGELGLAAAMVSREAVAGPISARLATGLLDFAWREFGDGDLLYQLQRHTPPATHPTELYSLFTIAGYRHAELDRLVGHLAGLRAARVLEHVPNRRLAVLAATRRIGVPDPPDVEDQVARTWLGGTPEPWILDTNNAYGVTHTVFHLTDWAADPRGLPSRLQEYLHEWLPVWVEVFTETCSWDLLAELLTVDVCLERPRGYPPAERTGTRLPQPSPPHDRGGRGRHADRRPSAPSEDRPGRGVRVSAEPRQPPEATAAGGLASTLSAAVEALVGERHIPAAVAAAVRGTRQEIAVAGGLTFGPAPTVGAGTPFALGSVTKTFTALLLAELAERGEVAYTDPITAYLPGGAAPRRHAEPPVTLLDLATHSGGLPRMPRNLYRRGLAHWFSNPYAAYDIEDLYRATARLRPRRRTTRYSTFGVGLLGQLLANAAGTSYPALLAERVLVPLGMTDSGVPGADGRSGRGVLAGAAIGHRKGRPARHWTFDALAGAGALYSSGGDLLRYLHAHLDPAATPLAAALNATHQPRRSVPHSPNRIGLVWTHRVIDGRTLLWHTGGTGGFTCYVGFSPEAGAGVAVLANATPTLAQPVVRTGRRLLRAVLGP